jgi:hypothetical protein
MWLVTIHCTRRTGDCRESCCFVWQQDAQKVSGRAGASASVSCSASTPSSGCPQHEQNVCSAPCDQVGHAAGPFRWEVCYLHYRHTPKSPRAPMARKWMPVSNSETSRTTNGEVQFGNSAQVVSAQLTAAVLSGSQDEDKFPGQSDTRQ